MDVADQRLMTRLVREGVHKSVRHFRTPVRIGTVSNPAAPGNVAQVILDEDSLEGIPTFATVGTARSVVTGDRVRVELAPPHGGWITAVVTPRARLPKRDIAVTSTSNSTGSVVDSDLSFEFNQPTAGLLLKGTVSGHHLSSASLDRILITVRDGSGTGIAAARRDFTHVTLNVAEAFDFSFWEAPDVGTHLRKVSVQRISGSGNCAIFADSDRQMSLRYENADLEFTQ